ncbi:hypothetical protein [Pontibacillus marinus]|uniref:Uncharacterized protein n=1 Tax=Pontibacillus marinus BH030004 = DSM 16465 TaxID=1385511 RepID=A0A0A5GG52_9BACI|nr:hypothetical protein [Pontibacillus marinus]KGX90203.1 hypothetical protein N783_01540 [Pontibacillus marinus BH030004 = DSM 16465]
MEEDWTTFSPLGLTLKYDYIEIDIPNNYGHVNIVDVEKQQIILELFIDLNKQEVKKSGSLEGYSIKEDDLIMEITGNVTYFIEEGISNP